MIQHSDLSICSEAVRIHDHDRWLTMVLAPVGARPALTALYALNVELTRIPEVASEPMVGLIRHRWWRESLAEAAVGGAVRGHPVLREIAPLLASGRLPAPELEPYLDAREAEIEDARPADLDTFEARCRADAGALARMATRLLGVAEAETLAVAEDVGTAHGMVGQLYNFPRWAARGRMILPLDWPDPPGRGQGGTLYPATLPGLAEVVEEIAGRAGELLVGARARRDRVAPAALPGLLIGPVTEVKIRRLAKCGFDVCSPKSLPLPLACPLAVLKGALTGRY